MGPENVNIDVPKPGIYRVYVHYFSSPAQPASTLEAQNTVRVYINGLQVAEYRRILRMVKDMWAVADIEWKSDNTAEVRPLSDNNGSDNGFICPDYTCAALTTCE